MHEDRHAERILERRGKERGWRAVQRGRPVKAVPELDRVFGKDSFLE
jgi:hypothetical protein